jgi:hypothetical protein
MNMNKLHSAFAEETCNHFPHSSATLIRQLHRHHYLPSSTRRGPSRSHTPGNPYVSSRAERLTPS